MYRPDFRTNNKGVPILSKREIETMGERYILEYCPEVMSNPQPVNVEAFAECYLGLSLDYKYLSHNGIYLGMMVYNDTDKVVIYRPELNQADYISVKAGTIIIDAGLLENNQEHRYRFTMGHESAHAVLHSMYYSYDPNQISMFETREQPPLVQCRKSTLSFNQKRVEEWTDSDRMEWQANYFSSVLLMPAKAIQKMKLKKCFDNPIRQLKMVSKVSKTFNVSPIAANYRLIDLGYLDSELQGLSLLNYSITELPE